MRTLDESVGWVMFPTVVDRRYAPSGAIAVRAGGDYGRRRRGPGGPRRILRGAGTGAVVRHRRTGGTPLGQKLDRWRPAGIARPPRRRRGKAATVYRAAHGRRDRRRRRCGARGPSRPARHGRGPRALDPRGARPRFLLPAAGGRRAVRHGPRLPRPPLAVRRG